MSLKWFMCVRYVAAGMGGLWPNPQWRVFTVANIYDISLPTT